MHDELRAAPRGPCGAARAAPLRVLSERRFSRVRSSLHGWLLTALASQGNAIASVHLSVYIRSAGLALAASQRF